MRAEEVLLDSPGWMDRGSCAEHDPELSMNSSAADQVAVCRPCPVRADCLAHAATTLRPAAAVAGRTTPSHLRAAGCDGVIGAPAVLLARCPIVRPSLGCGAVEAWHPACPITRTLDDQAEPYGPVDGLDGAACPQRDSPPRHPLRDEFGCAKHGGFNHPRCSWPDQRPWPGL